MTQSLLWFGASGSDVATSSSPSGNFGAAAQAFFTRSGLSSGSSQGAQYGTLIDGLVTDGVMSNSGSSASLMDAIYVMAAPSSQVAILNLVSSNYNLTPTSSPAFTVYQGFQGNGTNAYLDTNFNPTTATSAKFALNTATVMAWPNTVTADDRAVMGDQFNYVNTIYTRLTSSTYYVGANLNPSLTGTSTNGSGFWLASRESSISVTIYHNSSIAINFTPFNPPGSLSNANLTFLQTASSLYAGQISAGAYGGATNVTAVTALFTRLATYRAAVGLSS